MFLRNVGLISFDRSSLKTYAGPGSLPTRLTTASKS